MDHDLKQRLVGAAVITSLAAIFVPMLFDDPIDESSKLISELEIPVAPVSSSKTNSTLLPKSTNDVITLPEAPALKEQMNRQQPVFNKSRWFIQVGIFGEKSNAVAQQNKIRRQGFPVTIATVSGKNGLLYRVRVGPELDKKRAEAMKEKVDKLNNIKGILTSVDE